MRLAPAWATDPIAGVKFDRNAIEIPRYADIERAASRDFQGIINHYQTGVLNRQEAAAAFKERLQQAETATFVAGRRARGVADAEITDAEAQMLTGRHSRNMRYFNGFLNDIDNGKYKTGRNGPMTPAKRADLYARSLWSLFTRGEAQDWNDIDPYARHYWVLDPDAEHCRDCLDRARQSRDNDGFSWEELVEIGFPGENTVCRVECRCHIRTVRKRSPLPQDLDELEPAADPVGGIEVFMQMFGGAQMNIRVPAAGLPSVGVLPTTVERSIAGAGMKGPDLARALPLVPKVLTKPEALIEVDDTTRLYYGDNLTIWTVLGDDGRWMIASLASGIPPLVLARLEGIR